MVLTMRKETQVIGVSGTEVFESQYRFDPARHGNRGGDGVRVSPLVS